MEVEIVCCAQVWIMDVDGLVGTDQWLNRNKSDVIIPWMTCTVVGPACGPRPSLNLRLQGL